MKLLHLRLLLPLAASGLGFWLAAAEPTVIGLLRHTNGEVLLTSAADSGSYYRIETSENMTEWKSLVTVRSTGNEQLLDVATPPLGKRFYRALPVSGTNVFTGDHLATANGDAVLRPIGHASVAVSWNGRTLYSDPSNQNSNGPRFTGMPLADVIVVTHTHTDHFATDRLTALLKADTVIFAPQAVYNGMSATAPATLRSRTTVLANGATGSAHGMTVKAVAMYNLSNTNHPQGTGNGYVVTLGGKNVYFSGDTEDIPEMRALTGIDAAFVCMSLPSNMTVDAAASAVRQFRPRMVFPYHIGRARPRLTSHGSNRSSGQTWESKCASGHFIEVLPDAADSRHWHFPDRLSCIVAAVEAIGVEEPPYFAEMNITGSGDEAADRNIALWLKP
jgi:L-ascorbate metabolism protein UlaG (beta-lactamase superfamily)